MLFVSSEYSKPKRIQGNFIDEEEISRVVKFINEENRGSAEDTLSEEMGESLDKPNLYHMDGEEDDDLYDEALDVVIRARKASASLLQRRLRVGYARAARLLDIMEAKGVIGPGEGSKPRDILIDVPDAAVDESYDDSESESEEEENNEYYG